MEIVREEERLRNRILELHDQGLALLILGWENSYHNDFTLGLDSEKFIFMGDAAPRVISHWVGYVLWTKNISHSEIHRAKKQKPVCGHSLSVGALRRILTLVVNKPQENTTYSQDIPVPNVQQQKAASSTVIPSIASNDDHSDQSKEHAFAIAFLKMTGDDAEKPLSKFQVAKLLREHFGDAHSPLRHKNLLSPIIAAGAKNAGSYKATSRLLELVTSPTSQEPRDPIEKARWLADRTPELHRQKERLLQELTEIDRQLARASKAQAALETLRQI